MSAPNFARPATKLRKTLLAQFEPGIGASLLEFGRFLPTIEADVLIFMARKSLCLYDLLLALGTPPVERCVVSDRVLDMCLLPLQGKRVALIDDTLVVGTTLAKAKRRLQAEGATSVSVHTFCVDSHYWCKELIQPDSVQLKLDDASIVNFCAAEVRALSLLPRPYLVDFPLTSRIRLSSGVFQSLLSSIEWTSFKTSTQLQESHNAGTYSFMPTDTIMAEFANVLGTDLIDCIEIAKVRGFLRLNQGIFWHRFVPIITLKPLSVENIAFLLKRLVTDISQHCGASLERLCDSAVTAKSRQRLVQYLLSAALGHRFLRSLTSIADEAINTSYDVNETDRHFGPWLHAEMDNINKYSFAGLWASNRNDSRCPIVVKPATLPSNVEAWALDTLLDGRQPLSHRSNRRRTFSVLNLVTPFAEVFLRLFQSRELPARLEAKNLGLRLLDAKSSDAPNHDRLEQGLPWPNLIQFIAESLHLQLTDTIQSLFSLVLDVCNDLGITVPITCERDGVVFRAYRHGEDVRFSDGELALAYDMLQGLTKASRRQDIPRLTLEKSLVLLLKIGLATRFLEPVFGCSGAEGVCRIGFDLKGAVPKLVRGPRDRADREMWLSRYLVHRDVIQELPTRKYVLGTRVDGSYVVSNAPQRAYELGYILGMLLERPAHLKKRNIPLNDDELIILATCSPPRHAAEAIQVELDIFRRWYEEAGRLIVKSVDFSQPALTIASLKDLLRSKGHEAVHSSRLKYVAYRGDAVKNIVERCALFLERSQPNDLIARSWRGYWQAPTYLDNAEEKARFDPIIDKAAIIMWEAALTFLLIEVAIGRNTASSRGHSKNKVLKAGLEKWRRYMDGMALSGLVPSRLVNELTAMLSNLENSPENEVDYKHAVDRAVAILDDLSERSVIVVEVMEPMVDEFGQIFGRHDYSFMVYYDIKNSTAKRSGRQIEDVEEYRKKEVIGFKRFVNAYFHRLTIVAKKNEAEVYCWNGNKTSNNDSKHIFFSGKLASRYVTDVVKNIVVGTQGFRYIAVRIYVVPCGFAGSGAYRRETDTEISGERFWEHWSRVSEKCLALEASCDNEQSFLLVAGDFGKKGFVLADGVQWLTPVSGQIKSEIELLSLQTPVKYGAIKPV